MHILLSLTNCIFWLLLLKLVNFKNWILKCNFHFLNSVNIVFKWALDLSLINRIVFNQEQLYSWSSSRDCTIFGNIMVEFHPGYKSIGLRKAITNLPFDILLDNLKCKNCHFSSITHKRLGFLPFHTGSYIANCATSIGSYMVRLDCIVHLISFLISNFNNLKFCLIE